MSLLLPGCARNDEPPEPASVARAPGRKSLPTPPLTLSALAALPSARPAASTSAPVASAIIQFRERAISLAAPPLLPRHLALGRGFVVQIATSDLFVFDSTRGEPLTRVPLQQPRAAVGLPAGSVLVAALDRSLRFDPGQKRPHEVARLSLLPGFILEPRRDTQESVWVLQSPIRRLQRYRLDAEIPPGLELERDLADYDGGAFASLSDGSLLYSAFDGTALVHGAGAGAPNPMLLPRGLGPVWRLAAGDRINRAWVASATGELSLLEFTGSALRTVRVVRTHLLPFDFAASTRRLALVSVTERPQEPRRFSLSVYDAAGVELYTRSLGEVEVTSEADWVARASMNHELVLAERPPRVAVGGPTALRVFELDSGAELFAR